MPDTQDTLISPWFRRDSAQATVALASVGSSLDLGECMEDSRLPTGGGESSGESGPGTAEPGAKQPLRYRLVIGDEGARWILFRLLPRR
jgi:hypothetical protein